MNEEIRLKALEKIRKLNKVKREYVLQEEKKSSLKNMDLFKEYVYICEKLKNNCFVNQTPDDYIRTMSFIFEREAMHNCTHDYYIYEREETYSNKYTYESYGPYYIYYCLDCGYEVRTENQEKFEKEHYVIKSSCLRYFDIMRKYKTYLLKYSSEESIKKLTKLIKEWDY